MNGHIPNPNVVPPRLYYYNYPLPFEPYHYHERIQANGVMDPASNQIRPVEISAVDNNQEVHGFEDPWEGVYGGFRSHDPNSHNHNPLNLGTRRENVGTIRKINQRFGRRLEKTRDYIKEICSLLSVVTIFLASLSVSVLSYFHETLSDRPDGSPEKTSDTVVNLMLLIATITSLLSTIFLIMGAVYAVFGPVKPVIVRRTGAFFAMFLNIKILMYPLTRFLRDGVSKDELSIEHAPPRTVISVDIIDYAAGRSIRFMSIALVFAALSILSFFIGFGVFVWADQVFFVSIVMTMLMFVIPVFFFFSIF